MATDSILIRSSDKERQWVIQINELLERDDLQTAIETPAFIFLLPDSVRIANPDAYLPRRIALGPHHHFRPELYKMQFHKLHMAKKAKEELQLPDFHKLHDQITPLELRIRASFDTHLEIGGDTLAWIMLVDALFLLQLLLNFPEETANSQGRRSVLLPLPNFDDQNLVSQFQILSDVLKLENQVPVLVFKGILPTNLIVMLPLLLYHFCVSVSPFDLPLFMPEVIVGETDSVPDSLKPFLPNFPAILDQSHHLLHFIYFSILILPKYDVKPTFHLYCLETCLPLTFLQKSLSILGSVLNIAFIQHLNEAIALIMELLELLGMVRKQSSADHETTSSPPVIPSASQLEKVGLKFKPTDDGILYTRFNKNSATLFLPDITVNAFTETLFENLVAFEAMANLNPPALAGYLELMKALIATPKDLKILKDADIIFSHMGINDEEVVKLFNGVGSSISSVKKTSLEKLNHLFQSEGSTSESVSEAKMGIVEEIKRKYEEGLKGIVEEINQYYESCWRVKAKRFVKKYVCCVVKIAAVLAIVFLIFLVVARLVSSSLKLFNSSTVAGE